VGAGAARRARRRVSALKDAPLLQSYLFGLSAADPVAYAVVLVVVAAAGTLATLLPARRATRVDPALALRCE
jgi:ABC-type lipoprotein release transport system permease subunit